MFQSPSVHLRKKKKPVFSSSISRSSVSTSLKQLRVLGLIFLPFAFYCNKNKEKYGIITNMRSSVNGRAGENMFPTLGINLTMAFADKQSVTE